MSSTNIHTFAAIYIGSYEVSLRIVEMGTRNKKVREIDFIRSRIELGRDAYFKGSIGYELVEELCDILGEFTQVMKEYKVDAYEAYAAAALRDADNQLFILDQIKIRTGITVHILSNSEHRFISYKSIARHEEFDEMSKDDTAVLDIGGAGLQITIFSKGDVVTTQHIGLGTMRVRELLERKSSGLKQYEMQIEEMVEKEMETFRTLYLDGKGVKNLVVAGDYVSELTRGVEKNPDGNTVSVEKFVKYLESLETKKVEEIAAEVGLSNENDALIVPYMMIVKCMAQGLGATNLWAPGIIISDGIACDYAQRKHMYHSSHDFDADIISGARNMAKRYKCNFAHIKALETTALLVFDTMKKVHGLGKRERLMLQVAAILHDCGKYISIANAPICSHDIIIASEIIGLTHQEREIIADAVLYNTFPIPLYEDVEDETEKEDYLVIAKLAAILRVANAVDRSHRQKQKKVRAAIKGKELVITVETDEDIALEQALFDAKTGDFENVFSIKPVLKEKRVYF